LLAGLDLPKLRNTLELRGAATGRYRLRGAPDVALMSGADAVRRSWRAARRFSMGLSDVLTSDSSLSMAV